MPLTGRHAVASLLGVITRYLNRGAHAVVIIAAMAALGTAIYCVTASIGLQVKNADAVVSNVCFALPWLILSASTWGIWKRLRYAAAVPMLAVSAAFLCYMAWDDPTRPPAPSISNLTPTESKSYETYRRLLHDPAVDASLATPARSALPMFPGDLAEWPAFVIEHRAQIEHAWSNDASGQSWIGDMAENKPEGLYPPQAYDAPALDFMKMRSTAQMRWAKFHLYIVDGKPDEAVQLLLPLLRASHNLQRAGTTLVNQMIAVVLLKGCYQRLELIAENFALSLAARQEILVALNEAPAIRLVFSNAFIGEESFTRSAMESFQTDRQLLADSLVKMEAMSGDNRDFPPYLGTVLNRFLFNSHRTEREYSTYLRQSCELLQDRQFSPQSKLAEEFEKQTMSWRLKNPVGKQFAAMALPVFHKVGKVFWEVEDQRVALIDRL